MRVQLRVGQEGRATKGTARGENLLEQQRRDVVYIADGSVGGRCWCSLLLGERAAAFARDCRLGKRLAPACAHASSSSTHRIAGHLQSSHASLILHITCL
jgi:hypothetical protein